MGKRVILYSGVHSNLEVGVDSVQWQLNRPTTSKVNNDRKTANKKFQYYKILTLILTHVTAAHCVLQ
jgi:hypothetical protein